MTSHEAKKHEPKLWGGRFAAATDDAMEKFNASISYDQRMWEEDIRGSKCYAAALGKIDLLTPDELRVSVFHASMISDTRWHRFSGHART